VLLSVLEILFIRSTNLYRHIDLDTSW